MTHSDLQYTLGTAQEIAVLRRTRPSRRAGSDAFETWIYVRNELARVLMIQDPNFVWDDFINACGSQNPENAR